MWKLSADMVFNGRNPRIHIPYIVDLLGSGRTEHVGKGKLERKGIPLPRSTWIPLHPQDGTKALTAVLMEMVQC